MLFTVYDTQKGMILRTGEQPDEWQHDMQAGEGESVVEGNFDGEDYYITDGYAVERPIQPTTLSNNRLEHIPLPASLVVNNERFLLKESVVDLSFPYSNKWNIKVEAFPYKDLEVVIEN